MDDMEEDIEEKLIKICERWISIAKDSETIKHIYAVMDTIGGTKLEKYITEANDFLAGIKQTKEVKEIRNEIGKKTDGGVSLF
jgi:hypothetical protein